MSTSFRPRSHDSPAITGGARGEACGGPIVDGARWIPVPTVTRSVSATASTSRSASTQAVTGIAIAVSARSGAQAPAAPGMT